MNLRTFERTVFFEESTESIFSFFCRAENLQKITPPWLDFKILTPSPIDMRLGTKIDYQLKLYGIPVRWQTEITTWKPPHMFEDTQVSGPYRQWIHKHIFSEQEGGTLMRDSIEYATPGWILEPFVNRIFVKPNIEQIFSHRERRFAELFSIRKSAL